MNLANAIITQAAEDYKTALKEHKENIERYESLKKQVGNYYDRKRIKSQLIIAKQRLNNSAAGIRNAERFFYSDWCGVLTGGADITYILEKLKEEVL